MSAQPTESLRERQRRRLRTEIQEAALGLFAEHGFDAVTMEAVAVAAGISASTLFRHVATKEQLLLGVVEEGRAEIVETFDARPADEPVVDSLTEAILRRTARFADETPAIATWRQVMAAAPPGVRRASLLSDAERDALVARAADRLEAGPDDLRPGALVWSVLAAAAYAYERWLTSPRDEHLHTLMTDALAVVQEKKEHR